MLLLFFSTDYTGTHYAGTDYAGTHYTGTDHAGTHYTGTDHAGTDYAGTHYTGTHYTGTDYAGTDYPGTNYVLCITGTETIPYRDLSRLAQLSVYGGTTGLYIRRGYLGLHR